MPRPRKRTASTSGCAHTRSSASGIVSRVSPPARSVGLWRLQRYGTIVSTRARMSSGRRTSSRPAATQASAASTPQPPAVVNTITRRPRGSGWVAKLAAHSKACSTVGARSTPSCRQRPAKTRASGASEPVWLGGPRRAPPGRPPPGPARRAPRRPAGPALGGGAAQRAPARPPPRAGLAIAAARDERRAHAAPRADPQHRDVRRRRRAHEGELRGPLRHLGDALEAGAPEDLAALAVHGVDLAAEAEAHEVVEGGEAELPRVARGAGDDDAARWEERPEAREHVPGRARGSL